MDLKNKSGIYKLANSINSDIYIGSACDLHRRRKEHLRQLKGDYHYNPKLQNFHNKYEPDFKFEVLEFCEVEELIEREQWYLDNLDPHFNISPTAGNNYGIVLSDVARENMSKAKIKFFAEGGEPWNKGDRLSEEKKEQISNTLKEYYKNNPHPCEGLVHTEEAKKKMVEASYRRKGTHHTGHNGRVVQMDIETKTPLKIYSSCGEAATDMKEQKRSKGNPKTIRTKIAESIKDDRNAYGFKWAYEKDLDQTKLDELLET